MRISDWSSDVCSSDLAGEAADLCHVKTPDACLEGHPMRPRWQSIRRLMGAAHRQAGAVAEDGPKPSFLSREEPERAGKKVGEAVARSRPTAARRAMKRGPGAAFVTTPRITLGPHGTSSLPPTCSQPR